MFQNKEKSLFILNKEKFLFILDKEKNQNKEMPFVSHLLFKRGLTVIRNKMNKSGKNVSIYEPKLPVKQCLLQ